MARSRNIKPGFFDNEILGELPALTRLLFAGLWCLADREGRLQDRPKRIKKELLGYDDVTGDDVDAMLQQLHDTGFILRYQVGGERYIQVVNFLKHQTPHAKERESEIPAYISTADSRDMDLGVVAENHVKGRTGSTSMDDDDPHTDRDLQTCSDCREKTEALPERGAYKSPDWRTAKADVDVCKDNVKQESTRQVQDKYKTSTGQVQDKHKTSTRKAHLIPDSLNLIDNIYIPVAGKPATSASTNNTADSRDMDLGVVTEDHVKWRAGCADPEEDCDPQTCSDCREEDDAARVLPERGAYKSPDWRTAKTQLEIGFCRFWDAFPVVRKRAKLACWKKWQLIQPDEHMVEQMLRVIAAYSESDEWVRGYAPMPLTWLNQGRWEDDCDNIQKTGQPGQGCTARNNNNFERRKYNMDELEAKLIEQSGRGDGD